MKEHHTQATDVCSFHKESWFQDDMTEPTIPKGRRYSAKHLATLEKIFLLKMILLAQKEFFCMGQVVHPPTLPDPLVDWLKFAPEAKDWVLEAWASHKSRDPQLCGFLEQIQ